MSRAPRPLAALRASVEAVMAALLFAVLAAFGPLSDAGGDE